MKELQKEMETLKNGMFALSTVIDAYKNSVEILTIKLEELEKNTMINPIDLGEFIQKSFFKLAPTTVELSWSDNGFTADYELYFEDMVTEELGCSWGESIADAYINT